MGINDRKYMSDETGYRRSPFGGANTKTFTTKYVIVCVIGESGQRVYLIL